MAMARQCGFSCLRRGGIQQRWRELRYVVFVVVNEYKRELSSRILLTYNYPLAFFQELPYLQSLCIMYFAKAMFFVSLVNGLISTATSTEESLGHFLEERSASLGDGVSQPPSRRVIPRYDGDKSLIFTLFSDALKYSRRAISKMVLCYPAILTWK